MRSETLAHLIHTQGSSNSVHYNNLLEKELITVYSLSPSFISSDFLFHHQHLPLHMAISHQPHKKHYFTCDRGSLCSAFKHIPMGLLFNPVPRENEKLYNRWVFLLLEETKTALTRKQMRISRKVAWWLTTPCGLWLNWTIWT